MPGTVFIIPDSYRGERLDRVLESLVANRSRSQLQKLVRRGEVRIDGNPVRRSNIRVRGGERITLPADGEVRSGPGGNHDVDALSVLFEDEFLVAIDKPSGLLTHAVAESDEDSLATRLVARYGRLPTHRGPERPGIVHRLDRETSGVIVAARDATSMDELAQQFRSRRVEKHYLALAYGSPAANEFEVDLPLEAQRGKGDREQVAEPGTGKPAQTHFRVEQSFGEFCLLLCRPRTGRRHQIRVHATQAGFPILFDRLYRTADRAALPAGAPLMNRQALHASELSLLHPHTGAELTLRAPLPPDFSALLTWLQNRQA